MATINGTNSNDTLAGVTGADTIYGQKGADKIVGATSGQDLLVDGSFETANVGPQSWTHFAQVGGWQSDTGIEVWGKDFIKSASAGDKLMELDYDNRFSKVWQDVKTTAGEEYNLNLDTAMRPGTSSATNAINVFWNGVEVGRIVPGSTNWSTEQFKVVGTGGTDRLEFREDTNQNDSYGGLIDNVSLKGVVNPGNVLIGGTGNDTIVGGDNGDLIVGNDVKTGAAVDLTKMTIHEDTTAHVKFDGSGAGFHNTVGMYTYDDKGNVTSTKLLFADVSAAGVAGGASDFDMAVKAGQHIGFFVAPNAAGQTDLQSLIGEGGTFHLVNASDGAPANVNSGEPMQIAYESPDHQWQNVHTQYWTALFTTNTNDNADGFQHAQVTTDPLTGEMHVKFEDLWAGGDQNFFDANFTVNLGQTNAILMAHEVGSNSGHVANDDVLVGGAGNDTILGMSGADQMSGGGGNDKLFGGSGNDTLNGGVGDNLVSAGSGDDHIVAGGGNDNVIGGAGFDTIDFSGAAGGVIVDLAHHSAAGFGTDMISGVEGVVGSNFSDVLSGDKTDNAIDGGAGNDLIRGGKGADTLTGGAGDDTFVWLRGDIGNGVDHVTDFGNGKDALDLSAVFKGQKGDHGNLVQVVDDVAGSHLMAKIGGSFVEVAMLDNVHLTSAADMLKAGMLLV